MPPKLGTHVSIAGGVDLGVERALDCGCDVFQVFTKNNSRWEGRPLGDEEIARFRAGVTESSLSPVVAHDCYLINVASPDRDLWRRSIEALDDEVTRCERLGIPYLVMHPGSHVGTGERRGVRAIARALDEIHRRHAGSTVTILLENTAGQGTNIGWRFEQLAEILAAVSAPDRLGVCLDTAHTYAAGYDIGTDEGWDATWAELDRLVGSGRVRALHANDSKKPLGSRVDRHEHIGLGVLPVRAFLRMMNDPRLDGLPALLETPKTEGGYEDEQNLAVLRALVGRQRCPGPERIAAIRQRAHERARRRAETRGRLGVNRAARSQPVAAGRRRRAWRAKR